MIRDKNEKVHQKIDKFKDHFFMSWQQIKYQTLKMLSFLKIGSGSLCSEFENPTGVEYDFYLFKVDKIKYQSSTRINLINSYTPPLKIAGLVQKYETFIFTVNPLHMNQFY